MTTATMKRHSPEWAKVINAFNPGESIEATVVRFIRGDDNRLAALFRAVKELAEQEGGLCDELTKASIIAGDAGPVAVLAETFTEYGRAYLRQVCDDAEKLLTESGDAPDEPAAQVPTNGHHAQEDAAGNDVDDNSLVDVKHILNSAIPKARAVIAALQMVDGLPLLDNPDNHDGDKGIGAVAEMVSATLIRSIDGVIAEMPLAERARMVKLVMEQAGPHVLDFNVDRDEGRPIDTPAVVALLTRSGAEVESLIEALANQTLRDEIEMGITEALGCLFNAMPLDVQARTYKLIHARALQWRESAARKAAK